MSSLSSQEQTPKRTWMMSSLLGSLFTHFLMNHDVLDAQP